MQWFLGDLTNLIGAILTGQLATQILVAIYFAGMDTLLWGQWFYFGFRNRMLNKKKEESLSHGDNDDNDEKLLLGAHETSSNADSSLYDRDSPITESDNAGYQSSPHTNIQSSTTILNVRAVMPMIAVIGCTTLFFSTQFIQSSHSDAPSDSVSTHFVGRSLLAAQIKTEDDNIPLFPPRGIKEIFGYIIGIISAFLYLGSRLPQIFKNFKRRTTDGLSPLLFFCALMGNLTYSVSIFLMSTRVDFLLSKAPWILGSAGVVVQDLVVLLQFLFFGYIFKRSTVKKGELSDESLEQDIASVDIISIDESHKVGESAPTAGSESK